MFKPKPIKISSLQNPLVKHLVKLRQNKRYREIHDSVLISGFKLVREITEISTPKKIFIENLKDASEAEEVYQVSPGVLKKILNLPSPEPIAAEFSLPKPSNLEKNVPILVLDSIRDPGNLGTLIRTALGFGWGGIYFLPSCTDPFHDKVMRASRGALFHLPWQQGGWEELIALKEKSKLTAYIADMHGTLLPNLKSKKKCLLLLSNEAQGISERAESFGEKIAIPMSCDLESLNVATAGAILMYYLKP